MMLGDVWDRGERASQNQAASAVFRRQVNRHAATEGLAEQDDVTFRNLVLGSQPFPGRAGVLQDALLRRLSFALAVASVIEGQHHQVMLAIENADGGG